MFRKKKEARQLAEENLVEGFRQRLTAAEATVDTADRLLLLGEIRQDIADEIFKKKADIKDGAANKAALTALGLSIPESAAVASLVMFTGVPGIILLAPFLVGNVVLLRKMEKNSAKKQEEKAGNFIEELEGQKNAAAALIARTVDENLEAIAVSGRRDEIFTDYPDIKEVFAEVAARKISAQKAEKPQPDQAYKGPQNS